MARNDNKHSWLTDAQGRQLALKADRQTRLGRASDNDIVLEDISVSQHHAAISFEGVRAFLRDLGSSNGTFIEGSRVADGELTNGSAIRLGGVALIYRENVGNYSAVPSVSPLRNQLWTAIRGRAALSQENFFWARTGGILGALFLFGLVATLAGRQLLSSSGSSAGNASFGTLVDSQSYRLPNATSDFVGNWCGWERVSSCDPAGSCDEEPVPESMGFKSDGAGVVMRYTIEAKPDTEIRDINVSGLDPRHVRVAYTVRLADSTGAEHIINYREDLVSVSTVLVEDSSHFTASLNGVVTRSEEDRTELIRCTDEFRASEHEYEQGKNLVDKGEVTGQIPAK